MTRPQLHTALRAALATRNVALISELLAAHGHGAFAAALAGYSPRAAADVLKLLRASERDAVLRELPSRLRAELRAMNADAARSLPTWVRRAPQWSLGIRA